MVSIHTTKDASVNVAWPNNNYGSSDTMHCCETASNIWRTLVGFDISSIDVSTVTAAQLIIYCYDNDDLTVRAQRITGTWTESGVTWNSKPSVTSTNSTTLSCTTNGWKSFNILSMLQDQTGDEFGVQLSNTSYPGFTDFYSKEYSSGSLKAYLAITGGATDKYVDITTGSDSDSGNDWTNAYLTVKKGIDNVAAGGKLHIGFGNYSSQAAITLNKNLELVCETYNTGGGTGTVTLPPTT